MNNLYEEYRKSNNIPAIKDYGFVKEHDAKSQAIYNYISQVDFANGDAFCFKSGGDGDNGEMLMDLLDMYFMEYGADMKGGKE